MNTIKPIKTEADYEATLARVESLWGALPDTPEGDELEVLFTLVEAYEAKHYPIAPPDPIEAIKFEEVLNHKRRLSLEMICNLYKGLGISLKSLISL